MVTTAGDSQRRRERTRSTWLLVGGLALLVTFGVQADPAHPDDVHRDQRDRAAAGHRRAVRGQHRDAGARVQRLARRPGDGRVGDEQRYPRRQPPGRHGDHDPRRGHCDRADRGQAPATRTRRSTWPTGSPSTPRTRARRTPPPRSWWSCGPAPPG
ncbi:hypothetical protein G5V59_17275 [Nocardioides sp. W3-2-3]|uniref:hypothetical protein n=1 Tax=Nocardioides convexus TaxID=2712224 RepID=UPI00241888E0|nr:hypothetical protein [Nocardioides convexus]NHA01048.1 hypothetical protein [Nocardioides convexus]